MQQRVIVRRQSGKPEASSGGGGKKPQKNSVPVERSKGGGVEMPVLRRCRATELMWRRAGGEPIKNGVQSRSSPKKKKEKKARKNLHGKGLRGTATKGTKGVAKNVATSREKGGREQRA